MAKQIGADKEIRDSQFELLRILAMLMIVASHATQHSLAGDWSLLVQPMGVNTAATYLMGTYGQLGVCLFVIISSWFLCGKSGIRAELEKRILLHIYASRHIFVMTLAMSLFYVFKRYVRIGQSRLVNAIAGTTFGVYILHENPLFHAYGENGLSETALLFEQWLHVGAHFEGDAFYPLYFAACVFGVFAVCSAVEFLRQILCHALERAVGKLRRK